MQKRDFKKFKTQIIGLAIALLVLINSFVLIAISTATEEEQHVVDTSKITSTVKMDLEKYVNYDVEGQKGAIVQLNVKPELEFKEGEEQVPLKEAGVLINAPKINNEFPQSVETVGNQLKSYDKTKGEIVVISDSAFNIILDYGENCYINNSELLENSEKTILDFNGKINASLDVDTETIVKNDFENKITLEEKSGLISTAIETTPIYNGYIKNKKATQYGENYDINISKKQLGDETTIEITNNYGSDKVTYVTSKLVKTNILDILGNTGSLTVLDETGNVIKTIDKDTEADEKGLLDITYPENVSKIVLKITKPEKVGKIRIQSVKQIAAEVEDKTINKIDTVSTIKVVNKKEVQEQVLNTETNVTETKTKIEETQIYSYTDNSTINVENSKTEVNLKVGYDKYTWTNEMQNELTFVLELPTNSAKYNLFKNPEIEIKMPDEVEKVVLNNDILNKATISNANGLELKTIEYNEETKTIKVELNGEQTEYINQDDVIGTTVSFPAIVILSEEIESKETNIVVNYKNTVAVEEDALEEGSTTTKINVVNFKQPQEEQGNESTSTRNSTESNVNNGTSSNEEQKYKLTLTSEPHGLVQYNYTYYLKIEGQIEEESTVKIQLPDCMKVWSYQGNDAKPKQPRVIESTNTMLIDIEPEEGVNEYNYIISTEIDLNKVYSDSKYKGKTEIELSTIATLNDTYVSNESKITVPIKQVTITMTSPTAGENINYGDEVKYNVKVKCEGQSDYSINGIDFTNIYLLVTTPEEIGNVTAKYNTWEVKTNEEEEIIGLEEIHPDPSEWSYKRTSETGEKIANVRIPLIIPNNEEVNVEITGKAGMVSEDTKITAYAVSSNSIGEGQLESQSEDNNSTFEVTTNINNDVSSFVSHTILAYDEDMSNIPDSEGDDESVQPTPDEQEQDDKQDSSDTDGSDSKESEKDNNKFDFIVENYISKITTKNNEETEDKAFNNSKLAKIEINSKKIENTEVLVEYKILVTNVGNVAGTIGEVVDYVPNGLSLYNASNTNWIRNSDGTLTNKSIATSKIEPGESVELTLVLTRKQTENIAGTFKNRVTINKISNDLNIPEESTENNSSSAEVIISIGTGAYIYISIALIIVIALLVFLNFKYAIFRTVKFRMFGIILISTVIAVGYGNIGTNASIQGVSTNGYYYVEKDMALTARTSIADSTMFRYPPEARHRYEDINSLLNFTLYYIPENDSSVPPSVVGASRSFQARMTDTFSFDSNSISVGGVRYTFSELGFNTVEKARNLHSYLTRCWRNLNGEKLSDHKYLTVKFLYTPNDWRVAVDTNSVIVNGYNGSFPEYQFAGICIDKWVAFGGTPDYDPYASSLEDAAYESNSGGRAVNIYPSQKYFFEHYVNESLSSDFLLLPTNFETITSADNTFSLQSSTSTISGNIKGNYTVYGPFTINYKNTGSNTSNQVLINSNGGAVATLSDGTTKNLVLCDSNGTAFNPGIYQVKTTNTNYYFRIATSEISSNSVNSIRINAYRQSTLKKQLRGNAEVIWRNKNNSYAQRFKTSEYVDIIYSGGNNYNYIDFKVKSLPASIEIYKRDQLNQQGLEGIKFKILDTTGEDAWIQVKKTGNNTYQYVGKTTEWYDSACYPHNWDINEKYTTFKTEAEGYTVSKGHTIKITNLPAGHTYKIYEIGLGDYKDIYDLGTFPYNGKTYTGKLIETFTSTENQSKTVNAYNTTSKTKLQLLKQDDTEKEMSGIKFKILHVGNPSKWIKVTYDTTDKVFRYTGETTEYYDSVPNTIADWKKTGTTKTYTTFATYNKNGTLDTSVSGGKTVEIVGLPLGTYRIFELEANNPYKDIYDFEKGITHQGATFNAIRLSNSNSKISGSNSKIEDKDFILKKESNDAVTITMTNKATSNLQIVKQSSSGSKLNGFKFKILDKVTNKWVRFGYDKDNQKFKYLDESDNWNYIEQHSSTVPISVMDNIGSSYYTFTLETYDKGKTLEVTGLPIGPGHVYRIYEVGVPSDYQNIYKLSTHSYNGNTFKGIRLNSGNATANNNCSFEENGNFTPLVKNGNTVTVTMTNTATTKLKIVKTDKDTGDKLQGIRFKILDKTASPDAWVQVQYDGTNYNYVGTTTGYWTSVPSGDWPEDISYSTFITDSNGETITINGLPADRTYRIYEVALPSNLNGIYELGSFNYTEYTKDNPDGLTKSRTGTRLQKNNNATVSGGSITTDGDITCNANTTVTVTATNKKTTGSLSGIVWNDGRQGKGEQVRDDKYTENSNDKVLSGVKVTLMEGTKEKETKYTGADGSYSFTNIDFNNLSNYSIKFSYNGYTYAAVKQGTASNSSKAKEDETTRNALNQNGLNITTGVDINSYNNSITASITNLNNYRSNSSTVIQNLNLGLYEREMPDLALVKDIYSADVQVNGANYSYKFGRVLEDEASNKIDGDTKTVSTLGIAVEDKNPLSDDYKYSLPIYKADVEYLKDTTDDNKLKVSLTYTMALVNNSSNLYAKVNAINEYFNKNDMQFAVEKVYDENGNEIPVQYFDEISGENITNSDIRGYSHYIINFQDGILLAPNTTKNIFIKFNLPTSTFYDFVDNELYADKEFRNYAEISKYSVYSDSVASKPYLGYDNDSQPNNFINGVNQDDNDFAPGIKIKDAGERTITGTIFEDAITGIENNTNYGDSIYNEGQENTIQNVRVNLVDSNNNIVATTTSGTDGKYEFKDLVPGNYKVQFAWGEGENTKLNDENNTPVSISHYNATPWSTDNEAQKNSDEWYLEEEPRYSDARGDEVQNNTKVSSTLVDKPIKIGIEVESKYKAYLINNEIVYKFEIKNLDFGLIKKPEQELLIKKKIKHIKISSGTMTLVDAEIKDDSSGFENPSEVLFATYLPKSDANPFGEIKTEIEGVFPIDVEVTYQIDVTAYNVRDEDKQNLKIYDYLDDRFSNIINANDGEYKLLSVSDYKETNTIIDKAYENYNPTNLVETGKIKVSKIFDEWKDTNSISTTAAKLNNKKVVELTGLENQIKNNSSNDTVSFVYTSQAKLANDESDLVLVNDVEIVGVNDNYSNSYEKLIDRAERVVITPPTGENKNNVDTIMIIITSLISAIILVGGIKLIKKKVL